MKISTFTRHLREGCKNVIRNGWMTFASVSSITISLLILGVFVLLAVNVNYLAQQVESQVTVRVFLDVNVEQDTIDGIQTGISSIPGVKSVKYVSKAEGLELMRARMGESAKEYLQGLDGENNPLNDSFDVEVNEPRNVGQVSDQIGHLNDGKAAKPIVKVNYGKGYVESMFKVTKIVRNVGIALVICLAFTSLFLISNTIKLTILARSREIRIMKLVGATNGFIRWPFFIEGALLGLLGSMIPVALLSYGYWQLIRSTAVGMSTFMMQLQPFDQIIYQLGGVLLALGVVIGIWGSTLSVRKFLRA